MNTEPKRNLPAYIKINAIMDYTEGKMAKRAIADTDETKLLPELGAESNSSVTTTWCAWS